MSYTEISGDLFSTPDDMPIANCIAMDVKMGKGIAVEFKNRYGHKNQLEKIRKSIGDAICIKYYEKHI